MFYHFCVAQFHKKQFEVLHLTIKQKNVCTYRVDFQCLICQNTAVVSQHRFDLLAEALCCIVRKSNIASQCSWIDITVLFLITNDF